MTHYTIRLPAGVALYTFHAECNEHAIKRFKSYIEKNYPTTNMDMYLTSEAKIHCVRRTVTKIVEQTVAEYV